MGFGRPLGPYKVAFADFELRPGAQLPRREVPEESDYVFVRNEKDVGQEYVDMQAKSADPQAAKNRDLEANERARETTSARILFSQTSFEEDELRQESDAHQRSVQAGKQGVPSNRKGESSELGGQATEGGPAGPGESIPPPLVRFWYPTGAKDHGSWALRRWLPGFYYALGFANVVLWQQTIVKRTLMYMAGGKWQSFFWFCTECG